MASIIPPKKPRKPGMPKLSIPLRPSSSDTPSQGFGGSHQGPSIGTSSQQPHINRPPLRGGTGSLGDIHHGVAGGEVEGIPAISEGPPSLREEDDYYEGHLPYHSTASSIYPDTVPGPRTDQQTLTNDLKRAIGSSAGSSGSDRLPSSEKMARSGSGGSVSNTGGRRPGSSGSSSSAASGVATSSTTSAASPPFGSLSNAAGAGGAGSSSARGQHLPSISTNDEHEAEDADADLVLKDNLETLARLGEGASGEVRKCRHTPTGMIMAVKVSCEREQAVVDCCSKNN